MIGAERRITHTFWDGWPERSMQEGDWLVNPNTGTTYEIISEPTRSPSIEGRFYFDVIRLDQWSVPEPDVYVWPYTYARR